MNLKERNRNNVISRWSKIHNIQRRNINHVFKYKSRLCGFLAGDGSFRKGRYNISFFPDHESLIYPFNNSLKKVYNKKASIIKKENYYELLISSKVIYEDLKKLCNFGVKDWTIPKILFYNQENKIEWLRAYFDAEAYVGKKYIRISSVNKKGLIEIKQLLEEFNIDSKIYEYQPKNNRWNKTYLLTIYKKESITKYKELIGFNHKPKLSKLYKLSK